MLSRLQYQEIKEIFPKAKLIKATDWQIEDDSLELNKELSVQIGYGYYCLVQELSNGNLKYIKETNDANQIIMFLKALNFASTNIN